MNIIDEYFDWIYELMVPAPDGVSFRKLFRQLFDTEYTPVLRRDSNRAEDGIDLRYRFSLEKEYDYEHISACLDGPCSVLEMMAALALRIEENIMDDPAYGNRTTTWFWRMIASLGLNGMFDKVYDQKYVTECLDRFLKQDYEPNGKGGLFTIKKCERDLREVEIWYQCNWYLDSLYG